MLLATRSRYATSIARVDRWDGEAGYLAHIRNGSSWAVDRLADDLGGAATCLLCFEEDHATCHRQVIVDGLGRRGVTFDVRHLA
jgi:hypothetical protein